MTAPEPGAATHAVLSRGGGASLGASLRAPVERALGVDLGVVRVHTDPLASVAADELRARAFTAGRDIFFRAGAFDPGTARGRALIDHELVHVAQRASDRAAPSVVRQDHAGERQARDVAQDIAVGRPRRGARPARIRGLARVPDDGTSPPSTLQDLLTPDGTFSIPELEIAYRTYAKGEKSPSDRVTWARHVTRGAPRIALEKLLGPDYAKGADGTVTVPYREFARPADYTDDQLDADWQKLTSNQARLNDRLDRLKRDGVPQSEINSGLLNILRGNIGEVLSSDTQQAVLERIRQTVPGAAKAELLTGIRMQIILPDGTPSDPLLFSDNIIATVNARQLVVHAVFEVKVGPEGGSRAAWQIHKWIEKHLQDGVVISLSDGRRFTYKGGGGPQVVNLARAERHAIVAAGVSLPSAERTESGTAAKTISHNAAQTTEQVNYLARLVLEQMYVARPQTPSAPAPAELSDADRGKVDASIDAQLRALTASTHNGLPASVQQALTAAVAPLQQHKVAPKVLTSPDALGDPDVVKDIIANNGGRAFFGNGVVRLSTQGGRVVTTPEPATAIGLTLGPARATGSASGPLPMLPSAGGTGGGAPSGPASGGVPSQPSIQVPAPPGSDVTAAPPVINLHPTRPISVQGVPGVIQPSTPTTLRVGEFFVAGGSAEWVVFDAQTMQPIAGVFTGGEWYRVVGPGSRSTVIDAATGMMVPPVVMMIGGRPVEVEPVPMEPAAPPPPGGIRGGAMGAVGAVGGLIAVVNELLGPYAAAKAQERYNLRRAQAELAFWYQFGANPTWSVWDYDDQEEKSWDTEAQAGGVIYGHSRYPYVVDLDTKAFGETLVARVSTFQEFEMILDTAKTLGAIRVEDGRYYIGVSKPDRDKRRYYDVTEIIERARAKVARNADAQMRAELGALPAAQLGNVFRLKSGSRAKMFRSANDQPILSAETMLGPDPWVRTLGRTVSGGMSGWFWHGHTAERVLVAPANGDALHAAMNATYAIHHSLDDTKEEVIKGGRTVERATEENGQLESFVAGPDAATPQRFGRTVYLRYPDPDLKHTWSVAIGELKQFWVNASELQPLGADEAQHYAAGQPAPATPAK